MNSFLLTVGFLLLIANQAAFAAGPSDRCEQVLQPTDVIDWVTTADPMFSHHGVAKTNRLDGPLCIAKGLLAYMRYLGFTPNPDKTYGMVCRYSGKPIAALAKPGLTDAEMVALLRKSVHWLSEDQGYDDGFGALGTADPRGRPIQSRDLFNANNVKFTVILKLGRDGEERWVLLRRVLPPAGEHKESFRAQIEDPRRKVLTTGEIRLLPPTDSRPAIWQFGEKKTFDDITAMLSASLGFDVEE